MAPGLVYWKLLHWSRRRGKLLSELDPLPSTPGRNESHQDSLLFFAASWRRATTAAAAVPVGQLSGIFVQSCKRGVWFGNLFRIILSIYYLKRVVCINAKWGVCCCCLWSGWNVFFFTSHSSFKILCKRRKYQTVLIWKKCYIYIYIRGFRAHYVIHWLPVLRGWSE